MLAQRLLAPLDLMDRAELREVGQRASQAIGGPLDQIRQQSHQAHPIGVQTVVFLAEALPDLALDPPLPLPQRCKQVCLLRHDTCAGFGRRAAFSVADEVGHRAVRSVPEGGDHRQP